MLICYEYDYTADADIGIDDVAEDAVGDMLGNVGTQHRADDDTAEAIEIINCYSGGKPPRILWREPQIATADSPRLLSSRHDDSIS